MDPIKRKSETQLIPLEDRCPRIIEVLFQAETNWLSPREITTRYVSNFNPSDIHTTITVCNILSYSGVLEKWTSPKGEPIRIKFRLMRQL